MKNKIVTVFFLLSLVSTLSFSQKLGTKTNPYVLKFRRLPNIPILIDKQLNFPDSVKSKSDMIKSSESLINSIACLFKYIKTKDSTYQIQAKYFYKIGDSLYLKFYNEFRDIALDKYKFLIEGTLEKLEIYTNYKGLFERDKYGVAYYKLNNTLFTVTNENGLDILSYFTLSQEDLYIILFSEFNRIGIKY